MTTYFSNSLKDKLKDGVICIYTGSKPKYSDSNKYTFKTSSLLAIDFDLIKKDLTRENPLIIIHRNDGYHQAIIHDSIIVKASILKISIIDCKSIFEWRKTEKGNIAEVITLIKKIKNAHWPNKKETTFKVDIIKI